MSEAEREAAAAIFVALDACKAAVECLRVASYRYTEAHVDEAATSLLIALIDVLEPSRPVAQLALAL